MARGGEQGGTVPVATRSRTFDAAVAVDYSRLYGEPLQEPDRLVFIDKPHQLAYKLPLNPAGDRQNITECRSGELLNIGGTRILKTAMKVTPRPEKSYSWDDLLTELREAGIAVVSETIPV